MSQILKVVAFENTRPTKTCSKSTTKKDTRTALVKAIYLGVFWLAWKLFLKSVTETAFNIAASLLYKWQWRSLLLPSDYDGVCFSKDSDVYYKWQWWSLICSNLRVAQNGMFLKKPLYLRGGTLVPSEGRFSN